MAASLRHGLLRAVVPQDACLSLPREVHHLEQTDPTRTALNAHRLGEVEFTINLRGRSAGRWSSEWMLKWWLTTCRFESPPSACVQHCADEPCDVKRNVAAGAICELHSAQCLRNGCSIVFAIPVQLMTWSQASHSTILAVCHIHQRCLDLLSIVCYKSHVTPIIGCGFAATVSCVNHVGCCRNN
ncbi:hypothetical protein TcWFU_009720 [Taenia crassiceps]|uniref:Uncharacterized protein n=1 Tax=Taenia crassiceps TaxID=6207 RepID=A0ABR4Q395_9CEST